MQEAKWITCPVCGGKTRTRIREDTELRNFPLFCPKCKQEMIINVRQQNMSVVTLPNVAPQNCCI